ncbi:MAG TPA: CheR family methyltransferase [Thermoanaerobaculia bacterium]|nr:CheR family methyltransferase [Thermoanaerobaculia bacterium]
MTVGLQSQEVDELELTLLLDAVRRRYGYDFRDYAGASLRRRVRRAWQQEGVPTLTALQERVLHDPECLRRFVSCLSVNVTALFRDPLLYRTLRAKAIPHLRTYPFLRIWCAGCSTGEEVHSLAIVLAEEGLLDRSRVYATDLSEQLLDKAASAIFPLTTLQEREPQYRSGGGRGELADHFVSDATHGILRQHLRQRIVFSHHNLVSDHSFNEFHLIFCRNVLIYFGDSLRRRVHELLHESQARLGFLALGMRESLRYTALAERYQVVDEDSRLYRKVR